MKSEQEELEEKEFSMIKDLRTKAAFIESRAEKAALESHIANLELKVAVQNIYIKYKMSAADKIDEETGKIIRKEEEK